MSPANMVTTDVKVGKFPFLCFLSVVRKKSRRPCRTTITILTLTKIENKSNFNYTYS